MVLPKLAAAMYLWRFATAELDEAARELRVGGNAVDLEPRPLEVLLQLLRHAGEVVTKEDLLDAVYGHRHLSDGALAQAIRRLRRALQDEDQRIIATVHRVGYKLTVAVNRQEINAPRQRPLLLKAGDSVPLREHWKLVRTLGGNEVEVWLIRHEKTDAQRVLKLCTHPVHLSALKREVTLSRVLRASLGIRDDLVTIIDWNFDQLPFFIECEFGGINLLEWAESTGGLAAITVADRIRMIQEVAAGVAAAHSADVLHKDLKPTNVLAYQASDGSWRPRLIDFGSGRLLAPDRLEALRITQQGFTHQIITGVDETSGTPLYLAPELTSGQLPTVQSDVYALGVMLYQIIAGDFKKPITTGWEDDIHDELLREDIAFATHGNPQKRMRSAQDFVDRIRALENRRVQAPAPTGRLKRSWVLLVVPCTALVLAALWFIISAARYAVPPSTSTNAAANDAYLHALALSHRRHLDVPAIRESIQSVRRAVSLDPTFAGAWALLARENAHLYFNHHDPEASRREATSALAMARRLRPDLPETLLAEGYLSYWLDADYATAQRTLRRVHENWPDRVEATIALARIARREGRYPESAAYFEEAISKDPTNLEAAVQAATARLSLQQLPAALRLANYALDIAPNDIQSIGIKAAVYQQNNNLLKAQAVLAPLTNKHGDFEAVQLLARQASLQRDFKSGIALYRRYLENPDSVSDANSLEANIELAHLLLASADPADAKSRLLAARQTLERQRLAQPADPLVLGKLALVSADLGESEAARAIAQSAVAFEVVQHDAARLVFFKTIQARVAASTGDADRAFMLLNELLTAPFTIGFSPRLLSVDPDWDKLRTDPRFGTLLKIVAQPQAEVT